MEGKDFVDYHLTGRERDILDILWNSEEGMIASEVAEQREDLTINTVQAVLKKLLKREFIKVQEIVYSGTVLSRKYCPTLSEAEFRVAETTQNIYALERFDIRPAQFIADFLSKVKLDEKQQEELIEEVRKLKKDNK